MLPFCFLTQNRSRKITKKFHSTLMQTLTSKIHSGEKSQVRVARLTDENIALAFGKAVKAGLLTASLFPLLKPAG